MALKKKIDKAAYDKLPDHFKNEYIADGDDFKLDVEGDEDTGPLKRALERERANASTSKQRLSEVEAELAELSSNDARKKGDIATLEKQWQKKSDDQKVEYEGKLSKSHGYIKQQLTENVATQLANDLSPKHAKLLLPHIRSRLIADLDGDTPITKILDANGKESNLTLEQLRGEFVANKDFSDIITVTKASGGAGKTSHQSNGGAGNQNQQSADLSKASPHDLVAAIDAKKAAQ